MFCKLNCCGFLRVTPTMEGDVSEHGAPGVKSNSSNWRKKLSHAQRERSNLNAENSLVAAGQLSEGFQ